MISSLHLKVLLMLVLFTATGFTASQVSADHTWGDYHWARTANPFTLKIGDNVSSIWDSSLVVAGADWSLSSVLNTVVVRGVTNPKNCRPVAGRVEVCDSKYGNNGWLGIANVWTSGNHIVQGTVKMNNTYFNTAKYNTPAWRAFVMCQEIGHTLGLDHQDENFGNPNINTCMDYTSSPASNQHPNQHDYDMLETIYEHLDSSSTLASDTTSFKGNEIDHNDQSTWGKSIRTSKDGKASLYVKETLEGKIFTFVVWAE
jgi:hypothetical protein